MQERSKQALDLYREAAATYERLEGEYPRPSAEYNEMFQALLKAVELDPDYASAQYLIGKCYENGNGTKQNYKKAVQWYRKAAAQGHADAQYCLGECYEGGVGVQRSYKDAVVWYRKAAAQGHENAVDSIDALADDGVAEAIAAYRELNLADAQDERDYQQAIRILERFAARGDERVKQALAILKK